MHWAFHAPRVAASARKRRTASLLPRSAEHRRVARQQPAAADASGAQPRPTGPCDRARSRRWPTSTIDDHTACRCRHDLTPAVVTIGLLAFVLYIAGAAQVFDQLADAQPTLLVATAIVSVTQTLSLVWRCRS